MCKVSIGKQDYESLIKSGCFYVDKTYFIKEWWESQDDVTLITRPRRFGKTLNMSMLECFFSNKYAGRSDLFEGLSIWNDEKYRQLQGTYPVIFISFAGVKQNNYLDTVKKIKKCIVELYNKYDYIIKSDIFNNNEKELYALVKDTMDDVTAQGALNTLSNYLSRYYKKKNTRK